MENKVIYVPASVQDLPRQKGWYLLIDPKDKLSKSTVFCYDGKRFRGLESYPEFTHYLIKIDLPSEEDMANDVEREAIEYKADNGWLIRDQESFIKGSNYILSIINQKK